MTAMLKKVVVASDKFKGSLTASEASEAICRGLVDAWVARETDVHVVGISDGGEGFCDLLAGKCDGKVFESEVRDPLGRHVKAKFALVPARGAVLARLCGSAADEVGGNGDESVKDVVVIFEMASASGLWREGVDERRKVMEATTFGCGELLLAALALADSEGAGVKGVVIGLGGSATTDGGAGMAEALGARFLTEGGKAIEFVTPADFARVCRIDTSRMRKLPKILAASDVQNILLGESGAARVFGPQKGASEPTTVEALESGLARLVEVAGAEKIAMRECSGAAGGLGFGLMAWMGADIVGGFELLAELTGLEQSIKDADLVVTGEGALDRQSLEGKGPVGVARLAKKAGVKIVAAVGGEVEEGVDWLTAGGLDLWLSMTGTNGGISRQELMKSADTYLQRTSLMLGKQVLELTAAMKAGDMERKTGRN